MWLIAGIALLVAVATAALPKVTLPAASLRTRLAVLTRPAVAATLAVTVLGFLAMFTAFVYLPVIAAPSVHGATISWVLAAFGCGQVFGNWWSGRCTDRFGPGTVRLVGLTGTVVALAVLELGVRTLPTTLVVAVVSGAFFGMVFVPQQHRLFTLAPDAPTVALGLNGSAIYVGAGLGSALGGITLATAGVRWVAPVGALVAVVAVLMAARPVSRRTPTTTDPGDRSLQTSRAR
jgi:predicted MFS family arabinose efflux permease